MSEVPSGAMRFNSDSQKLEYWDGAQWLQVSTFSPNLDGGARGVWAGGYGGGVSVNVIQYINISSTGNAQDFGDLSSATAGNGGSGSGSNTRGLFHGGGGKINIDYITISSTGNAQDFGNSTLTGGIYDGDYSTALSNGTRGIGAGGWTSLNHPVYPAYNVIEYVTISSTGNAVDYGDLTVGRLRAPGCASPTRGLFFAGQNDGPGSTKYKSIDFISIATLGNAQDFGDLTTQKNTGSSCSNSIRGLYFGGNSGPSPSPFTNSIEYVTIATLGNSTDFGDLTSARSSQTSLSSSTRGVSNGGYAPSGNNTIDYINIATQGNAVDFGDILNNSSTHAWCCSNAHGGL